MVFAFDAVGLVTAVTGTIHKVCASAEVAKVIQACSGCDRGAGQAAPVGGDEAVDILLVVVNVGTDA